MMEFLFFCVGFILAGVFCLSCDLWGLPNARPFSLSILFGHWAGGEGDGGLVVVSVGRRGWDSTWSPRASVSFLLAFDPSVCFIALARSAVCPPGFGSGLTCSLSRHCLVDAIFERGCCQDLPGGHPCLWLFDRAGSKYNLYDLQEWDRGGPASAAAIDRATSRQPRLSSHRAEKWENFFLLTVYIYMEF